MHFKNSQASLLLLRGACYAPIMLVTHAFFGEVKNEYYPGF